MGGRVSEISFKKMQWNGCPQGSDTGYKNLKISFTSIILIEKVVQSDCQVSDNLSLKFVANKGTLIRFFLFFENPIQAQQNKASKTLDLGFGARFPPKTL